MRRAVYLMPSSFNLEVYEWSQFALHWNVYYYTTVFWNVMLWGYTTLGVLANKQVDRYTEWCLINSKPQHVMCLRTQLTWNLCLVCERQQQRSELPVGIDIWRHRTAQFQKQYHLSAVAASIVNATLRNIDSTLERNRCCASLTICSCTMTLRHR